MEKEKYTDKSSDKDFFSIIPNYIVNHSSHWEKSLYLTLKRITGEKGSCWLSPDKLAKIEECSANQIRKTLARLTKRGWIKNIGKKGKTKPTNEYVLVNLWHLNSDYYKKKESSLGEQSKKKVHRVKIDSSLGGKSYIIGRRTIKKNTSVSKADDKKKEFNFNETMTLLLKEKRRDLQIIGLYWKFKNYELANYQQYQSALKRELRPSKKLCGYSNDRIEEVMDWLEVETDIKWTLETCHKFIDDDLSNIGSMKRKKY